VFLEADAVARPVDEVVAVAGGGDHVAGGGVDRLGHERRPGPPVTASSWPEKDVVEVGQFGRRSPTTKVRVMSEQ